MPGSKSDSRGEMQLMIGPSEQWVTQRAQKFLASAQPLPQPLAVTVVGCRQRGTSGSLGTRYAAQVSDNGWTAINIVVWFTQLFGRIFKRRLKFFILQSWSLLIIYWVACLMDAQLAGTDCLCRWDYRGDSSVDATRGCLSLNRLIIRSFLNAAGWFWRSSVLWTSRMRPSGWRLHPSATQSTVTTACRFSPSIACRWFTWQSTSCALFRRAGCSKNAAWRPPLFSGRLWTFSEPGWSSLAPQVTVMVGSWLGRSSVL